MPINNRDELEQVLSFLNYIFKEVQQAKHEHPEWRTGYKLEPGSLLNAYREGDLSFEECKSLLIHTIEDRVQDQKEPV